MKNCECKDFHEKFITKEAQKRALLKACQPVRCSAKGMDGGRVHVLFEVYNVGPGRHTIGYIMDKATYAAIPLGENATPADYERHGQVEPGPATYDNGATTKQVSMKTMMDAMKENGNLVIGGIAT